MSTPAGGLVGDATINVNANTARARGELNRLTRDVNGRLRDMRGRFVNESNLINGAFNRAAGGGSAFKKELEKLKGAAIGLAPALIPIAAQAAPIAASVGAAAAAIGVFAAAAGGQVAALTEASEAEKKYQDAMAEHGRTSKQASEAQAAYVRSVEKMPPATREAAAALSSFKDQYQEWSDSLAGDTMPVITKSLQAFGAVFPKLTPIVQGAGVQLNRFVTIVAGGVASPGFDRFMKTFAEFSTGALRKANDALIRFMRTADAGKVSGGVAQFMDYVRENGPMVRDTLAKVAQALGNVLEAAANVGPGLLTVVNALAGLVAAVPPGLITAMLQLAVAMKAVRLAAVAMAATSGAVAAFTASIAAMQLAAAGATGVLPRLSAAFGALSASARFGAAAAAVGAMVLAVRELSDNKAPVAVDELSTSLNTLASTGEVTGALKSNFDEMTASIAMLSKGASDNKLLQLTSDFGTWVGIASGPSVSDATKNLDAWDKSMANLVAAGKPKEAAAQFEILRKAWGAGGGDMDRLKTTTNDYQNALAAQKYEQELAVKAMGIFGQQAQDTSAKLAAQKASADGLRQAISALNNANLVTRGGIRGMEAAIDAATEAAKANGRTLDENTEKGRNNNQALDSLASATLRAAESARESGASWQTVNGIYDRGRAKLIESARAMGLNEVQAKSLADQILKTPDKTARLRGNIEDLDAKLKTAKDRLGKVPDSRKAEVRAGISQLEAQIRKARRQLDALDGKTARTYVTNTTLNRIITESKTYRSVHDIVGATGGLFTGAGFKHRGYVHGGLVSGPGTETSDSIFAPWLSKNEFVVNAKRTRQFLPLLKAINSGGRAGASVSSSVGSARTSGAAPVTVENHYHFEMTNRGVLGSRREVSDWLVREMESLRLQRRLPGVP